MNTLAVFDPNEDLIFLNATVHGPLGARTARLALDTGATTTMIRPGILAAIGYDYSSLKPSMQIITGSGVEIVRELAVRKIQAFDQTLENLTVLCHDLPEESGIDGLLGLNFLRLFDIEIKYSDSTLTLRSHSV